MTALFNSKGIFQCCIIVCLFFAGVAGYAQTYKPLKTFNKDTIAYIQYNFIDDKSRYIDQSIDKLLNDMEIPITYIIPAQNFASKVAPSEALYLLFFSPVIISQNISNRANIADGILIEFSPPIEHYRVDSIARSSKTGHTDWNKGVDKLYRQRIITDILPAHHYFGPR